MSLDIKFWWVRWYLWSLKAYGAARHDEYLFSKFSTMTNLCFFMRVSLVYGPLIVLSHIVLVGLFLTAFFVLPWWLFGTDYLKFVGILGGVFAAFFGIIAFFVFVSPRVASGVAGVAHGAHDLYERAVNNPSPTNFAIICIQYLRSIKERSCPLIVLEDKDV